MQSSRYHDIRLVRYTKLIDRAILENKHTLATQLAYRCLLEYYRLFFRFFSPHRKYLNKNAFQLSMDIVRYVRKQRWSQFKSRQLFSMLSTSYQLTNWFNLKLNNKEIQSDLAMATYAREQVLAISELLVGSMDEIKGEFN